MLYKDFADFRDPITTNSMEDDPPAKRGKTGSISCQLRVH
jgi:hypothetical protein